MDGDLNGRTPFISVYRTLFSVVKPNQVSFYVRLRFAAAVLITGMFNCVVMRCLVKQQENEQLPAQKAFHRHASRVHNSCKKSPQGDSAPVCGVCVRVCVRHGEQKRERERLEKGGGCSVKIISGFSVRMNFTTVSSHEII